ncbi:MAG: protoporphyrinogen oxidase [Candidatus Hydrogenedentota bacterium]
MTQQTTVAIVGGGITGLCAGFYAAERFGRDEVLVLEASDRPGGTVTTERSDGFVFDCGPNGFLDREPRMLEWIEALGLSDELVRANAAAARRFILKNERLMEVKPPPAFLFSPLLSVRGRLRLLKEPFAPPPPEEGTPETIHEFAARRIGPEAAEMLVGPMVSGVFGGDARILSLQHCFPRMRAMEREHGSLTKAMLARRRNASKKKGSPMGPGGVLTTLKGGIGTLPERAAERLGDSVRTGCEVTLVESAPAGGFRIYTAEGDAVESRYLVVAAPAHAAADFLQGLDGATASALGQTPYAALTVVCTAYRREDVAHPLDGFGFLAPRNQGERILGCIWTSTLFPEQAPGDWVLLRTMIGGYGDPGAAQCSDQELLDIIREDLHSLLAIEGDPALYRIYRWPWAIPQYTVEHGKLLEAAERAEAAFPGLFLAGNAYRGVGMNDCVVSARNAIERLEALHGVDKERA